jgi:hypothetical protein
MATSLVMSFYTVSYWENLISIHTASVHETQTAVNAFCKMKNVYGAKMAKFT